METIDAKNEQDPDNDEEVYEEPLEVIKFTEQILSEYKSPFEYHIFDPKEYKYETHKDIIIVKPEHRITSEIMTKYEYTEVISVRAKQIENNGTIFCDIEPNIDDPIKFAEMEVIQKKCPLNILRMYNLNYGELWSVNEMEMPVM